MAVMVRRLNRDEIQNHIESLARLRIDIFRDFPYLYQGSSAYEVNYLKKYLASDKMALVAAFDDEKIVGVSTCLPLLDEEDQVQKPFKEKNFDIGDVFYFGESVLQKKYRGRGLGKLFFNERENWAQVCQAKITAFCAVERPANHPERPVGYRPLDEFWMSRGYVKRPDMQTEFSWQDLSEKSETKKRMIFWVKQWA